MILVFRLHRDVSQSRSNAKQFYQLKDDIKRLKSPVQYAKRQGVADRAYQEGLYPETNAWERLGVGGIQGSISSASICAAASEYSARTSAGPQHRQQDREDIKLDSVLQQLSSQAQKAYAEIANLNARTDSELIRAKYAKCREYLNALAPIMRNTIGNYNIQMEADRVFQQIRNADSVEDVNRITLPPIN